MKSSKSHSVARTSLVAAALGAAMMVVSAGAAFAERSFSGVRVDTSAIGSSSTAQILKTGLEARLRYYFASDLHGDRSAPLLVVRLTSVSLQTGPLIGGRDGRGGDTDYLEGEALVVGRGGQIILRHPLLAALNSGETAWYLPDFDKRKTEALANSYAYWLKRELPN